ncbi:hypothetical protein N5C84_31430 [Klebsiella pneumoniae]|nr:hypothetical protein [Klebsiella pneumoniae]
MPPTDEEAAHHPGYLNGIDARQQLIADVFCRHAVGGDILRSAG